jgi:hypothetical protein
MGFGKDEEGIVLSGVAGSVRSGKAGVRGGVTPHVSKPHDYVNHMFMRP